jgi:RNA polymerase sigma-70 factor (ECF subfamily)
LSVFLAQDRGSIQLTPVMGNRADELFTRFRKGGDPNDLAEVFDLCAHDLLKVAMHLCPTDGEAEDLVQETFLAALEHASRYRPGESVSAWLLGILRNRARELRKRTARHPEPDRLREPSTAHPVELLMQGEFLEAYEAALVRIPTPYREVLDLRLRDDLRANEIAQRLERPSGTVRTQIYRAMELLRAALPAGAAVALTSHTMTRGMGSLRAHVVEQATVLGQTTFALGSLLAMKKTALAAATLLIASSVWYATRSAATPALDPATATVDLRPSAQDGGEATQLSAPDPDPEPAREALATAPEPQAPAPAQPEAHEGPFLVEPYQVIILAVDNTLEPVVGARVSVHEAQLYRSTSSDGSSTAPGASGGAAGAQASERAYTGRAPGTEPVWTGTTDGLGNCVLRLDREFCYVNVEHEHFGPSTDEGVSRRLDGKVLRIVLEPSTHVTGVVRGSDGNGVPGARVQAWTTGGDADVKGTARFVTQSDGHGRYEFNLPAGLVFGLRASEEGRYSDQAQVYATRLGGAQEVDLQLPGAYRVLGIVLQPDGSPAVQGTVRARSVSGAQSKVRSANLDPEEFGKGRFEVLMTKPGEYIVTAHAPGMAHSEVQRVVLDDDGRTHDVTLRLQPLGSLEGRVLDPEGEPRPGLEMKVNRQQPGATAWVPREEALLTRTDAKGVFRVEGVQPSSKYTFTFAPNPDHPNLLQRVRNIEGWRKDAELHLDPALVHPASVTGRVLDGATGRPMTRFEVTTRKIRERGHASGRPAVFSAEDGRFELGGLERGLRYALQVEVDGRQAVVCPEWTAEGEHHVEIVFPEQAAVECMVWTRDGAPASETLLSFVPTEDRTDSARGRTDEEGTVVVLLDPGSYQVHALVSAGIRPEPQTVEVQAGERRRVDVQLK